MIISNSSDTDLPAIMNQIELRAKRLEYFHSKPIFVGSQLPSPEEKKGNQKPFWRPLPKNILSETQIYQLNGCSSLHDEMKNNDFKIQDETKEQKNVYNIKGVIKKDNNTSFFEDLKKKFHFI